MKSDKKKPKFGAKVPDQKTPASYESVSGQKVPNSVEHVGLMRLKACWRVNRIQMVDPYGWHELTPEAISNVREKLSAFETRTWNEIFVDDKKHNHSIPVNDIRCPEAKKWMRKNMPDQGELWTIRFTGTQRVWGIFGEGAYQVVFWDPNHQIMPTLK